MKSYSQKLTKNGGAGKGSKHQAVSASKGFRIIKPERAISRFEGMSKDVEVLESVHIPGYRVRG